MANRIRKGATQLYRFSPHGSKKIEDLTCLGESSEESLFMHPEIYCHDQEPLNYDLYETGVPVFWPYPKILEALNRKNIPLLRLNFRGSTSTVWDRAILVHSEKRSSEVGRYQSTQFITVYYWCHAIVSLDWYRFAQHVFQKKQVTKTFLIYNRAWSNTREYRLKFAELLVGLGLQDHCQTSVNPIEPELDVHYDLHQFKNSTWRPNIVLENYFPTSSAHSSYSADFDIEDYEATDIEVVLETLFDDSRLHLTEKSLRPIACAQPFILAGTQGSLEYLRSYGFKTFGDVWDEYYDCIENPQERLLRIAELMEHISAWTPEQRDNKMAQAQAIADYNKQHFFSGDFFNLVVKELEANLTNALTELEDTNTGSNYLNRRKVIDDDPELYQLAIAHKKQETRDQMLLVAQQYNDRQKLKKGH